MIGFGELRKRSVQWNLDLSVVERAYATDWLLKGIFDDARLARSLVLRGSAALRYAYSAEYAPAEPPEFFVIEPVQDMETVLSEASQSAARASGGLKFSPAAYARGIARVEYAGPLGRRSAAQPHVDLSFIPGQPRLAPACVPLVHPFGDACAATVYAVALEELVGERMAALAQKPRARDVFDLWFALAHAREKMDPRRARELAAVIAQDRHWTFPRPDAPFEPDHRAALERAWDAALKHLPNRVPFAQVEKEIVQVLQSP